MATALPAASAFTGSTVTEAQFKTAMTDMRTYLADLLGTDGVEATALAAIQSHLGNRTTKTATYTVTSSDLGAVIDCTSGTFTVTTPAAATVGAGFFFSVVNTGSGIVTLDGNSSETIDGATTVDLSQYASLTLMSNGSNWFTVGSASGAGSSYYTTDTTNRSISGTTKAEVSLGTINIPASGYLLLESFTGQVTAGASQCSLQPGLRVSGTDYDFARFGDGGLNEFGAAAIVTASTSDRWFGTYQGTGIGQVHGAMALDIAADSIGTGAQNVIFYLRDRATNTGHQLDGATVTTRIGLRVVSA